jgi:hypothetical protein
VEAGSAEEQEYLGLPGLLTQEQVHLLLQKRQREQMAKQKSGTRTETVERPAAEPAMTNAQKRLKLRKQLNALVGARSFATNEPHGKIHAMLRSKCGGPPSAQATIEQLEERIAVIRSL